MRIAKAITAHEMWRTRLCIAIESGKSEFIPEKVKLDNACDFGKWFYSLPEEDRVSSNLVKVRQLHAEFHQEASRILAIALQGKKNEAEQLMAPKSRFSSISYQLVNLLVQWAQKIK